MTIVDISYHYDMVDINGSSVLTMRNVSKNNSGTYACGTYFSQSLNIFEDYNKNQSNDTMVSPSNQLYHYLDEGVLEVKGI